MYHLLKNFMLQFKHKNLIELLPKGLKNTTKPFRELITELKPTLSQEPPLVKVLEKRTRTAGLGKPKYEYLTSVMRPMRFNKPWK